MANINITNLKLAYDSYQWQCSGGQNGATPDYGDLEVCNTTVNINVGSLLNTLPVVGKTYLVTNIDSEYNKRFISMSGSNFSRQDGTTDVDDERLNIGEVIELNEDTIISFFATTEVGTEGRVRKPTIGIEVVIYREPTQEESETYYDPIIELKKIPFKIEE